jgi:two-component system heavy metal sensor histidine kinase CusS
MLAYRTMYRASVVTNLTLWFCFSAFGTITLCTAYLYWSLAYTVRLQSAHLLSDKLQAIEILVSERTMRPTLISRIEKEWVVRNFEKTYVRVTDQSGKVISQTPAMSPLVSKVLRESKEVNQKGLGLLERLVRENIVHGMLSRTKWVETASKPKRRVRIEIGLDCSYEERVMAGYRNQIYFALPLAFLICGFFGWHLARRGIQPIFEIAASTGRISATNLHERIGIKALPVELESLAENFNAMLDRLEGSFRRLSQFSADIAHELRTPLNNARGELEVTLSQPRSVRAYQEALSSSLEECDKISRIIDSLIFMARAEDPAIELKKEKVNLSRELQRVLDFYEASASEAGIRMTLQVLDFIAIEVDKIMLQRAVGNLISNAVKHTGPDGSIFVRAQQVDEEIVISVRDTGCGIAQEHLPFVFDRFFRADKSRSKHSGGHGLGLAIVQSIANIHRGKVQIESHLGSGTVVEIILPMAASNS